MFSIDFLLILLHNFHIFHSTFASAFQSQDMLLNIYLPTYLPSCFQPIVYHVNANLCEAIPSRSSIFISSTLNLLMNSFHSFCLSLLQICFLMLCHYSVKAGQGKAAVKAAAALEVHFRWQKFLQQK